MFGLFNKRNAAIEALQAKIEKLEHDNAQLTKAMRYQTKWSNDTLKSIQATQRGMKQTLKRVTDLEMLTDTSVHMLVDTAEQTKKHQRHIAGLFRKTADLEAKV